MGANAAGGAMGGVVAEVPDYPKSYTSMALGMLLLAYVCNFMDRTIISTLAQAIKVDLQLTDGQLGLLQGFAFVVVYAFMGLPMAKLTEKYRRTSIISGCLFAWSLMTMLCGAAMNFWQLLLCRMGVGIGEAGCNPSAHSMIADYFPASKRASALAVYTLGVPVGTMIGAMTGGLIAQHLDWRIAFVVVGAPGILLAVALKLLVKEPARVAPPPSADPAATSTSIPLVIKRLTGSKAIVHHVMGFTMASFASAGVGSFAQPYFIRVFDFTYAQTGLIFGFFAGLGGGLSIMISGRLCDKAVTKDTRWHAWIPGIGVAASAPLWFGAFTVGGANLALACVAGAYLFLNAFITPTLSAVHKLVGSRRVATAMALILFFQNILGLGGGPFFTGEVIDAFARNLFTGGGDFIAMCPGGVAPAGSAPDLVAACSGTLQTATRYGLLVTLAALAWSVLHYVLAAKHTRKELAELG